MGWYFSIRIFTNLIFTGISYRDERDALRCLADVWGFVDNHLFILFFLDKLWRTTEFFGLILVGLTERPTDRSCNSLTRFFFFFILYELITALSTYLLIGYTLILPDGFIEVTFPLPLIRELHLRFFPFFLYSPHFVPDTNLPITRVLQTRRFSYASFSFLI